MPQRLTAPDAFSRAQLDALTASQSDALRLGCSHVPSPTCQSSEARPQKWPGAGVKPASVTPAPPRSGMQAVELRSDQSTDQLEGRGHGLPFIMHDGDTDKDTRTLAARIAARRKLIRVCTEKGEDLVGQVMRER